jgi:hypothetical protein
MAYTPDYTSGDIGTSTIDLSARLIISLSLFAVLIIIIFALDYFRRTLK